MHHAFLDEHSDIHSPINRFPVRPKLIGLFLYILAVVSTPFQIYWAYILYLLLMAAAVMLSRLPLKFILKRIKEIMPFVLLVLVCVPFMHKEQRLFIFLRCFTRAVLASMAMIVILSTTRFTQILEGLKSLRVPAVFIKLVSFMYRYIFVLEDEFARMQRSLLCRGAGAGKNWLSLKAFANLLGVLFIRAFERAERIYLAMLARGLNGAKGYRS